MALYTDGLSLRVDDLPLYANGVYFGASTP